MGPEHSVTQIISEGRVNPAALAALEKFRRSITVMFTDIKGSTSYFEKHGDIAGMMMVQECNDLLRKSVETHQGQFVKTIGDAVMATFEDCGQAVRAAIEMQKALVGFNAPKPQQDWVTIRIGLNYGAGIVRTNDVFGDVVNVASRVESVAQPEQIVISDTVHERVQSLSEFQLQYLGRFSLKGKEEDRDLYEVRWQEKPYQPVSGKVHVAVNVAGAKASLVASAFRIQQLKQDGSVGIEKEARGGSVTIGSTQGDLQFPGDPRLAELHARFTAEGSQLFVEDLSNGKGVFVRLLSVYTLQDGDQVIVGNQVLSFRTKAHVMAAAAATGTQLTDMAALLNEPVAEMVSADGSGARYPLLQEEVSWGRNKATYTFPEDRFMSRTHAKIYQRGEDFFLEDVGSRNGTFVRVRGKVPVPVGANVRAGGQILRVQA